MARSYVDGPAVALTLLASIEQEGTLGDYQPFYAAKAELLRRTESYQHAAQAYDRAISLTQNTAERQFLKQRLDSLPC